MAKIVDNICFFDIINMYIFIYIRFLFWKGIYKLKRRIITLLAAVMLLSLCLGLASCGKDPTVPDGYQLISNDDVPYRFYAPTQWSINTGTAGNSVYYTATDRSMVVVTSYVPDSGQETIDAFWAYVEGEYKAVYGDYMLVESAASAIGGRNAMRYTFTATIGAQPCKVLQVVTAYGNSYYMLTYTSTPENFDAHLEDVEGMI